MKPGIYIRIPIFISDLERRNRMTAKVVVTGIEKLETGTFASIRFTQDGPDNLVSPSGKLWLAGDTRFDDITKYEYKEIIY